MIVYDDGDVTIHHGDCVDVMRTLPDCSVDSVVTDPPYGLDFMGKHWDTGAVAFSVAMWAEALRVLKPGGHLVAFGGTRTYHRLACPIEDAGFEIRDSLHWVYGSGFPKSLDVSKALDKAAGATQEVVGETRRGAQQQSTGRYGAWGDGITPTAPATDAARQWQGWGTALKPAHEPIVLARKPLAGTVAANVSEYGTGALNVDGCRVGTDGGGTHCANRDDSGQCQGHDNAGRSTSGATIHGPDSTAGRWPPNVILDPAAAAALDAQSGDSPPKPERTGRKGGCNGNGTLTGYGSADDIGTWPGDAGGGASRFFPVFDWPFQYQAKANADERPRIGGGTNANVANPRCRTCGKKRLGAEGQRCMCDQPDLDYSDANTGTSHPTVKPVDLMRWLVRLVTPPGGVVLEPFAGSGTTAEACIVEGFRCIAIERETDYIDLIRQRLTKPIQKTLL